MTGRHLSRLTSVAAAVAVLLGAAALHAQGTVVALWPDGAPGSEGWGQEEVVYPMGPDGLQGVRNVSQPSITAYLPPAGTATGTAVIVAPGGAFRMLAWTHEGTMVAEWLQRRGVAAFVLKYRLIDTGTDEEFANGWIPTVDHPAVRMSVTDSLRAIEVVRAQAGEWQRWNYFVVTENVPLTPPTVRIVVVVVALVDAAVCRTRTRSPSLTVPGAEVHAPLLTRYSLDGSPLTLMSTDTLIPPIVICSDCLV
jgi:hypothetical protein